MLLHGEFSQSIALKNFWAVTQEKRFETCTCFRLSVTGTVNEFVFITHVFDIGVKERRPHISRRQTREFISEELNTLEMAAAYIVQLGHKKALQNML